MVTPHTLLGIEPIALTAAVLTAGTVIPAVVEVTSAPSWRSPPAEGTVSARHSFVTNTAWARASVVLTAGAVMPAAVETALAAGRVGSVVINRALMTM